MKLHALMLLFLLMASSLVAVLDVQPALADGAIYIRTNGSVDPPTAPVFTIDNRTYALTDDLANESIVVQRDNIVLDGAGFTLQGSGSGIGIDLSSRRNVTVENTNVQGFSEGIYLYSSSGNIVSGNNVTANSVGGVVLYSSSNNNISKNGMANNYNGTYTLPYGDGVLLRENCNNNVISRNNITDDNIGIYYDFDYSSSNSNVVFGNNITGNHWFGIMLFGSDNMFFHNNFVNNTYHDVISFFCDSCPVQPVNFWDDGYPSGGNYWSNYNGTDTNSGPKQNETGRDGIGDVPYSDLFGFVEDNYPLMKPWVSYENGTIYIRADGSIDPSGAPIQRKGDLYTLTGNVTSDSDGIVIERDNMTLDGAGYTLQGSWAEYENIIAMVLPNYGIGIDLSFRSGVAIRDTNIHGFTCGIMLKSSSNDTVSDNNATDNVEYGISLTFSTGNTVADNNAMHGWTGIGLDSSSNNNTISGNSVRNTGIGVDLESSPSNTVSGNDARNNYIGIYLSSSSSNMLRDNVMVNNSFNFDIFGGSLSDFVNDVDVSNTVDEKPIYYLINAQDACVPLDAGYVALVNSTRMTVENLNLSKNEQGILLVCTTNTTITRNNMTNNGAGVTLVSSSNNTVSNNVATGNSDGIALTGSSSGNVVFGNTATHQSNNGIGLYSCSGNTVWGNSVASNGDGIWLSYCSNCTVLGNTATGQNYQGIELWSSSGNTISGNNLTANNDYGVRVASSSGNIVSGNVATNSPNGISFESGSDNNTVSGNTVTNNGYGIAFVAFSNNNTVLLNIATNNSYGIYLDRFSSYNLIYQNSFIINTHQVSTDGSPNNLDNGSTGNYWSDYLARYQYASELDSSGIWNMPYVIDPNNTDHYPLVNPVIPEFPSAIILPLFLLLLTLAITVVSKKLRKSRCLPNTFLSRTRGARVASCFIENGLRFRMSGRPLETVAHLAGLRSGPVFFR